MSDATNLLLAPRAPDIDIYTDGFEKCRLGRAPDGKRLSDLVEKVADPMVIALDAPWGAGKSFFLKCWVGAYQKENGGTAQTVYFDAFKYDFMDDPLISLTSEISERLEKGENSTLKNIWAKTKKAAPKLARFGFRMGAAVATQGATEAGGALLGAAAGAAQEDVEAFWKKEEGRRAAMEEFRAVLKELASKQKLVIVVDELDRCRPDYALTLLEVIKHFFDVPNVHFVLGASFDALACCVQARYGQQIDGQRYLQKFVTLKMTLPRRTRDVSGSVQVQHFETVAAELGLRGTWQYQPLCDYLGYVHDHVGLSLRDVEKIATLAVTTPAPSDVNKRVLGHLYAGLLILQVLAPGIVSSARKGELTQEKLFSIFRLRKWRQGDAHFTQAAEVWGLFTENGPEKMPDKFPAPFLEPASETPPRDVLRKVIEETLDVFQLP